RVHARDRGRAEAGAGRGDAMHADREAVSDGPDEAARHTLAANPLIGVRGQDLLGAARVLLGQGLRHPFTATTPYFGLLGELGRLATGRSELAPGAQDRRFADPAWKESAVYRTLAQAYLAWSAALNRFVDQVGLEPRDAERARFLVSLVVDAL